MNAIEVQGPRRCGTNWTKALLEKNTDLDVFRGDRFSCHVPTLPQDRHVIVVTKHPQAYIVSLEDYLKREGRMELNQATQRQWRRRVFVETWVAKMREWLVAAAHYGRLAIVRYENLLVDAEAHLGQHVGPKRLERPFEDVERRVKALVEPGELELEDDVVDRDYYLDHAWRNHFSSDDVRHLRRSLDNRPARSVLERLSYQLQDPLEATP